MMTVDATRDYTSIGVLASHLRVSVRSIEQAAERLDIVPAMRLDNIVRFDAGQVELLIAELRKDVPGRKAL